MNPENRNCLIFFRCEIYIWVKENNYRIIREAKVQTRGNILDTLKEYDRKRYTNFQYYDHGRE